MGEFAEAVQDYMFNSLSGQIPSFDWQTEYDVAGTPVDVVGKAEKKLHLIELEWKRADPADNTAKIFRHLESGEFEANEIIVLQIFTDHYALSGGGVSSKQKNAEFVGNVAAETFDHLTYIPVSFKMNPPKRGSSWPDDWERVADDTLDVIVDNLSR
jgi:hypothetical protein